MSTDSYTGDLPVYPHNARNCKTFKLTAKSNKSKKFCGFGDRAACDCGSLAWGMAGELNHEPHERHEQIRLVWMALTVAVWRDSKICGIVKQMLLDRH
jgi:hypothetical protein